MPLVVRRPDYQFEAAIPKHWLGGSPLWTHTHNAFTLIFPEGERYLVRVIGRALKQVEDPELRAIGRAFVSQEAQHAVEHQRFLANLGEQGYRIEAFGTAWRSFLRGLESTAGPGSNLAMVAAVEHFATILGDETLRGNLLDQAHPRMAALFAWHACEEIEHRAVALDIAGAVGLSYPRRVAGLALVCGVLPSAFVTATALLLLQDGRSAVGRLLRDGYEMFVTRGLARRFARGVAEYLGPGFDPNRTSSDAVAATWSRYGSAA